MYRVLPQGPGPRWWRTRGYDEREVLRGNASRIPHPGLPVAQPAQFLARDLLDVADLAR